MLESYGLVFGVRKILQRTAFYTEVMNAWMNSPDIGKYPAELYQIGVGAAKDANGL